MLNFFSPNTDEETRTKLDTQNYSEKVILLLGHLDYLPLTSGTVVNKREISSTKL